MPQRFYQKPWFKISSGILLAILILTTIAGISINAYWSPIIGEKVKKAVYTATDSLYQVDFSKIKLRVLQGDITIDDITLTPDTALYNKRKLSGDAANNLYRLKVKRLILDHVHPWKLYRHKALQLGAIRIVAPDLEVQYENLVPDDSLQKDKRTLYERIKKDLTSVKVDLIDLQDINFKYVDLSDTKPAITILKDLDLSATHLLIDSSTQFDKSRFLYCTNVSARLDNYKAVILDEMYTYQFKSLLVSTQKNVLEVVGLTVKPNFNDLKFASKYKVQKDRYDLAFDSIRMEGFDLKALNKYRNLRTTHLYLKGGKVNIFLDRRLPKPNINKGDNYPHNALKRLKFDLKADTVSIQDVDLSYTEFDPKSEMKGKVVFKKLRGDIYNVTNNKTALKINPIADADLSTYLMGYGKLDVHMRFNLVDKDASFSYSGSLGKMELKRLNPVSQPLGKIKINSGTVNSLKFDIRGNIHGARGNVTFLYDNLKVSILKRDNEDQTLKKQGLISAIANVLIIKDANPDNVDTSPRTSTVNFERPKQGSFFNVMWKTVFLGVKDAIGLTLNVEERIKTKEVAIKQNKKKREERREERELRREKRLQQHE